MNDNLDLLAVVLLSEFLPITRQARHELLRHLLRCAREILSRLKGGAP